MKVILLKDVAKVGRKYEVKEVADGFARNALFPRKLAELAMGDAVKRIEKMKREAAQAGDFAADLLAKNLAALGGKTVILCAKANEKGHLFQGIHKEEIAEAIRKELGLDIPPDSLSLEKPIKEIGGHEVAITGVGKNEKKVRFTLHVRPS